MTALLSKKVQRPILARDSRIVTSQTEQRQNENLISAVEKASLNITLCKTDVRTKPEIFSGDFEKRKSAGLFRTFS